MQSHSVLSINRNVSSSTALKFAAASTGAIHHPASRQSGGLLKSMSSSFGPMGVVVGILGGMVSVACLIGIHTAKQQLLHSPSVQLTKKRRECIPEVDSPEAVIQSADKFMSKSFLRKVGHIQDRHAHNMNEQARYDSSCRYDHKLGGSIFRTVTLRAGKCSPVTLKTGNLRTI
ncbi:hypothetical protein OROMI_013384 [Orobanche minor]